MIPIVLVLSLAAAAQSGEPPKPRFQKAVVVIFENTDSTEAFKQPFFAAIAKNGAYLADYHGIGHPSQPNYLALVSGGTQGVKDDSVHDLDAESVADRLEKAGRDWRVYAEGYPGGCFLRPVSGRYARKHVPLLSFKNVQSDPKRCAKIVNASEFFSDLSAGKLPDFSLFIPDLNDDGHDTGVAYANNWFSKTFMPLLARWPDDAVLIATFDEDARGGGSNQVYAALYGGMIAKGSVSSDRYNHYNLLRTLEDEWKLGDLGDNDAQAAPVTGVWK